MKKIFRYIFLIFLFFLISKNTTAQGWIMSESNNNITIIDDGWIKSISNGEKGEPTFMFNASKNLIFIIDDTNSTFAKGSGIDYCNGIQALQNEMNKQIPQEQLKMIQDMINQQKTNPIPKVTVSEISGEVIAGYETTKYSINVDGELFEEKWITNDPELVSIVKLYRDTQELMSKSIICSLPKGWPLNSSPEFSPEYKKVENSGIELKSVKYEYGNAEVQTDVISLEKEDFPESEFEAPTDYENISFKEILMSMYSED
jgi:Domain of unknown function (DUF4412)